MRKRLFIMILCLGLLVSSIAGITFSSVATDDSYTVSYLEHSDLLDDLMETATVFVMAQHKAMGGSHYAYTEGLYEESTGEAANGVGTESVFNPGSRLVLVTLTDEGNRIKKEETVILNSKSGCLRDPDVSEDGTKLLFSWKKNNADDFHIYEMSLTDGEFVPTQLTFGSGVADTECMYLPNGEILFSSSRTVQTVDCWITPVSNLYKMSATGENIVRLGYDQVHTTYPTLTEDGRVIYTRWDYNDRTQMYIQALFQMNPDGTNQTELYGNNSNFPTTLTHVRAMTGSNTLYAAIATGHHTLQAGKLCVIDVSQGRDGPQSISFPFDSVAYYDNVDIFGQTDSMYQYPYPYSDTQMLVSYARQGWSTEKEDTPFGIWMMDIETGKQEELIAGTAEFPAAQIVAVKNRDMFVRPSMVDYQKDTGTYYIGDVYEGEAMEGVERGTVKQIRVVALDYRAYAVGATMAQGSGSADPYTPISTGNGSWDVKMVLGVATVYEDGSAMFTVPSETPVYFQLLDADGNMIQTMRSWSTLMPGEYYSCVGCHEDNNTTPPASATITMAARAGVETLKPEAWQVDEDYDPYTTKEGFDYLNEVQPILDANCISCHNNRFTAFNKIQAEKMQENGLESIPTGKEEVLIDKGAVWEYYVSTIDNPTVGWNDVGFSGNWQTGKAGFGDRSDVASVGTHWSGDKKWIFIRKTFTVNDVSQYAGAAIKLTTLYDDSPIIYLNGEEVFSAEGKWVDKYTDITLDGDLLQNGENVLAISINQHSGGRYIDCALSVVKPVGGEASAKNPVSLESVNIGSQRMSRYFPLSYLVLTGSLPKNEGQWIGTPSNSYTNWLSSMSGAEIVPANTYGASTSRLMQLLRAGHQGVELSDTELRTIAAWIDLCVPAYGSYDANNHWDLTEKREAEEEQNKRDYYVMRNEYSRLAMAGMLPEGELTVTYKDKSANKEYTLKNNGITNLYVPTQLDEGDVVTVTLPDGQTHFGFTLTPKMGEAIIYCPDGTFTYEIPALTSMVTTISKEYANTTNYITARILTEEEIAQERNLAENVYDYNENKSASGQYPHVTASTQWEDTPGDLNFLARNAIDGFTYNLGHGSYPCQSWGPANTGSQWIEVDFGRGISAKELGIIIRHDFPHDTYFNSGVVELTYADGTTENISIVITDDALEQRFDIATDKPVTKLRLKDLVAENPGGWAAITELAVYGSDIIE